MVVALKYLSLSAVLLFWALGRINADPVRVATYNLENYLIQDRVIDGRWRPDYPKPEREKAALRAVIKATDPDIVAVQEIGAEPFLAELQADLALDGIDYPYVYWMRAEDEVRHIAVLSRIEAIAAVRHDDLEFAYLGGRARVKRGMLELGFESPDGEIWKLFVVHLKSPWSDDERDPQSTLRRTREAEACRDRIVERTFGLGVDVFLVAGDFNDHPESAPLRRFYRRGDLRISERVPATDIRGETWTHHYAKEGSYSTVDGFVASPRLVPAVVDGRGHIVDEPSSTTGSDHRLIYLDLLL